jgi:RimJ/RimL family protein N-acetyltransferase
MQAIHYRIITGRGDADIKSLAAISVLDNKNPETLAEGIDYFRDELEHLDSRERLLIGAFAGMELVGFCRFQVCPRLGLWWCLGLEVVPEWQRRGIGSELLSTAIAELRGRGATDIRSDVSRRNEASCATHTNAGFRLMSTEGEDFDGRRRDGHCFYRWHPCERGGDHG